MRDKHEYFVSTEKLVIQAKDKEAAEKEAKRLAFWNKLKKSDDLNDNLQELVDHLNSFTESSAVYIGKLVPPKKAINDDDDDVAHVDAEAPKIINFLNASESHEFMVGQVLPPDEGISH